MDPAGVPFEGLQRARFVDVDHGVELVRQVCMKIVALSFRLGLVDHTDRALQARFCKPLAQSGVAAQPKPESGSPVS